VVFFLGENSWVSLPECNTWDWPPLSNQAAWRFNQIPAVQVSSLTEQSAGLWPASSPISEPLLLLQYSYLWWTTVRLIYKCITDLPNICLLYCIHNTFSISVVTHCTLILMYLLSWCICPLSGNFNWKLNLNSLRISEI